MTDRLSTTRKIAVCVFLLALAGACSNDDDGPSRARSTQDASTQGGGPIREFELELRELSGSGVTGTAQIKTLGQEAGDLVVELDDAPDGELALHTHSGPCVAQATAPTHQIEPVVDGRAETRIAASVQGLTHGGFNLSVHANEDGDSEHITCGEIGAGPVDE